MLRVRLDADVAAQANWCGLRVGGAWARFDWARMTLRRGTPVRCVAQRPEDVVVENDRVLVTVATRSGQWHRVGVYRGCAKPAGEWQTLDQGHSDRISGDHWPVDFAVAGSWVAWRYDSRWGCTLSRRDLAGGGGTDVVVPAPRGDDVAEWCVTRLALSGSGALAWVERLPDGSEQVKAGRPGTAPVTLATGVPSDAVADLAIAADDATVTWRQAGQSRSAPLPAAG